MKRITISIVIIAILALGAQHATNVQPYFSENFGDCGLCHNTPAMAWNASNAYNSIIVDGFDDDSVWGDTGNTMYAPVSPPNGPGLNEFFPFIKTRISQNTSHLFVVVRWVSDEGFVNGSDSRVGVRDMFAMIWNVNQKDFTLDMWQGNMKSADEGTMLDQFVWIPTASETGKNSTNGGEVSVFGRTYDEAYTDIGKTTDDTNDWVAGARLGYGHGSEYYYLEMVRPLVTVDGTDDVQFKYDGYYGFAMAYWNQTMGDNHFVTYEQYVWIHGVDGINPADINEVTVTVISDDVTVTEISTEMVTASVTTTESETITEVSTSDNANLPLNGLFGALGVFCIGLVTTFIRRRK